MKPIEIVKTYLGGNIVEMLGQTTTMRYLASSTVRILRSPHNVPEYSVEILKKDLAGGDRWDEATGYDAQRTLFAYINEMERALSTVREALAGAQVALGGATGASPTRMDEPPFVAGRAAGTGEPVAAHAKASAPSLTMEQCAACEYMRTHAPSGAPLASPVDLGPPPAPFPGPTPEREAKPWPLLQRETEAEIEKVVKTELVFFWSKPLGADSVIERIEYKRAGGGGLDEEDTLRVAALGSMYAPSTGVPRATVEALARFDRRLYEALADLPEHSASPTNGAPR